MPEYIIQLPWLTLLKIQILYQCLFYTFNKTFYFIDTPTRQVMAYSYELETGEISNPRLAVRLPEEMGWPDGMTSDQEGMLWDVLLYEGIQNYLGADSMP